MGAERGDADMIRLLELRLTDYSYTTMEPASTGDRECKKVWADRLSKGCAAKGRSSSVGNSLDRPSFSRTDDLDRAFVLERPDSLVELGLVDGDG